MLLKMMHYNSLHSRPPKLTSFNFAVNAFKWIKSS
jgi:hypothetical protein